MVMVRSQHEISRRIESRQEIDPEGIVLGVELEVKATSLMREHHQVTKTHSNIMKMVLKTINNSLLLNHPPFQQIKMVLTYFTRRRPKRVYQISIRLV